MSTATAEPATDPLASIIRLPGEGYGLAFEETAAQKIKLDLIKNSKLIVEVTDTASCDVARAQVKELAKWRTSVEKCREIVKAPVLAKGKEIDALAKAAILETDLEEKRLTNLIGAHATKVEAERQAELRRQREEEQKRIAEEQRLAREAAEKERLRIEAEQKAERDDAAAAAAAEAARKAAEDAQFADDATEETEAAAKAAIQAAEAEQARIAAEQEATRIAAEAERQRIADEQAEAARVAAEERAANFAALATEKVQGVKFEPELEVTDIHKLYAAVPELVKLEVKRADTIARIRSYMEAHGGELPTVPGLAITKKPVVSKR